MFMVEVYWRHIFFWKHEEGQLEKFTEYLNKTYTTVKFTAEQSESTINYLLYQ